VNSLEPYNKIGWRCFQQQKSGI